MTERPTFWQLVGLLGGMAFVVFGIGAFVVFLIAPACACLDK